jgi:DNA-binding response OmpR family regulator
VEDEQFLREAVATFLSSLGFTVMSAETGTQALRAARARHFDLLILDVMLRRCAITLTGRSKANSALRQNKPTRRCQPCPGERHRAPGARDQPLRARARK